MTSHRFRIVFAFLILASLGTAYGQNQQACRRVEFSPELLERFPNAQETCLDVISRDGQQYAVFKAQLDRVIGSRLQVRFRNPDGSFGPATRIATERDFRVLVDGRPLRVSELSRNQELTAYVQVNEPMVALAPADASERLHPVPLVVIPVARQNDDAAGTEDAEQVASNPTMPATAGYANTIGALGLALLAGAIAVKTLRRARSLRQQRLRSFG
jgi:hypothetical protein